MTPTETLRKWEQTRDDIKAKIRDVSMEDSKYLRGHLFWINKFIGDLRSLAKAKKNS
jgi:hypothetical protein